MGGMIVMHLNCKLFECFRRLNVQLYRMVILIMDTLLKRVLNNSTVFTKGNEGIIQ